MRRICRCLGIQVLGAFSCISFLIGCTPKKEPPKQRPSIPVAVALVGTKTVPVQLTAIGNVEPYSTVAVRSQVNGTVVRVHFAEGQDVRKGDVLFTIDPAPFQAALRQAEAVLARDAAQAKNAEEQAKRYSSLINEGIVTREQYESYRTAADALHASVAADKAAVENARIQLGYCTIRSPLTGRTGNLAVNAGNVVKSNETVLVAINQVNPIYVTFTVPEKELPELRQKLTRGSLAVSATVPSDPVNPENGMVTFLDNGVDPATGMFKVKGTFSNKNRKLWPGQFVNAVVTLSSLPQAVVVPQQAVMTGQKGQHLFVVKNDGTAEQRPVVAGINYAGETVIQKGVQAGETVVIDGQMRLSPGAKVEAKKPGQSVQPVASANGTQPVPGAGK